MTVYRYFRSCLLLKPLRGFEGKEIVLLFQEGILLDMV